jgi:hypothetical protein
MRFWNLEKYKTGGSGDNMTLGIPLPKTPDGRVDRYSPNDMPALRIKWSSAKGGADGFA